MSLRRLILFKHIFRSCSFNLESSEGWTHGSAESTRLKKLANAVERNAPKAAIVAEKVKEKYKSGLP
jgi:hypothetical protein